MISDETAAASELPVELTTVFGGATGTNTLLATPSFFGTVGVSGIGVEVDSFFFSLKSGPILLGGRTFSSSPK